VAAVRARGLRYDHRRWTAELRRATRRWTVLAAVLADSAEPAAARHGLVEHFNTAAFRAGLGQDAGGEVPAAG
jgi:hypothetical protein